MDYAKRHGATSLPSVYGKVRVGTPSIEGLASPSLGDTPQDLADQWALRDQKGN